MLQKEFWTDFEKYGFTSFAGVPYNYDMLNRIGFTKKMYPSLRYFTQAGGKLSDALVEKFGAYAHEHAYTFFVMYGQTEATARMSYMDPAHLMQKIGSIGKPIKNGTFIIEEGELCYTGPNVFGGYAEAAADLATWDDNRTLHTGDLARVDKDGFYYITGRLKRFVKLFGNRVNLDEVERDLHQYFAPAGFLATGIEDKHMLLVKRDNHLADEDIKRHISEHYKIHPSVLKVIYLADIPLTSNGKPDYNAIKALL
jgi:acyl-CoA synthetase (AMP-forming)/AMP-acid ligase II